MSRHDPKSAGIPALWAQGLTLQEIADRLGLTYWTVSSYVYKNREACPKRCNHHVDMRQAIPSGGSIPKRTIMVPFVPNSGITQSAVFYTPVSVPAFSWDVQT